MDVLDKGLQSLVCETSNKKSVEENRVETELEKNTVGNGEQLRRILPPVKCPVVVRSTTTSEKLENEEEECTTPKAEQFRIPPPLVCPPAPKPKRRSSFFTGDANN